VSSVSAEEGAPVPGEHVGSWGSGHLLKQQCTPAWPPAAPPGTPLCVQAPSWAPSHKPSTVTPLDLIPWPSPHLRSLQQRLQVRLHARKHLGHGELGAAFGHGRVRTAMDHVVAVCGVWCGVGVGVWM